HTSELQSHVNLVCRLLLEKRLEIRRVLDRKSTRLNSSHMSISYALFCLKKNLTNAEKMILAHRVPPQRDDHVMLPELDAVDVHNQDLHFFFFFIEQPSQLLLPFPHQNPRLT